MKNNKDLYVPTEAKKEKMFEHIKYEMNMLRFCYKNLNIEEGLLKNVFIESFLIHSRNLYKFFYSDNRYEDDVIAKDYVINIKEFLKKRSQQDEFRDFKNKWNKMLSHLSYSRLDYIDEKKQWNFTKLFQLLDKTEKAFFCSIPKNQKSCIEK